MPTSKSDIRKLEESTGFHPDINYIVKLSIKGVEVPASSIVNITVREWITDLLPRIELQLSDNSRLTEQFPLEDNDEIKIELNHFIFEDPPIKSTFLLQDYEILNSAPGKSQQTMIRLSGLLKTTDLLYPIRNRVFSGKNSSEIFTTISTEAGFENFEARISPKDEMNWLQLNQNNYQFIKHVLKRAYVNNDDVPFLYSSRNGKLIYTSLKTEILKSVKEIPRMVFNIESAMLNSKTYTEEELEDKLEDEKEAEGEGVVFFYNWKYKNMAGGVNKTNSYGREFSYYDLTDTLMQQIKTDVHPLSTHSLKEKDKIGLISKYNNYGMLDKSNTHEHFILATEQNKYLMENFFSSYLLVYTRPTNTLNLFDRVNVEVPSSLPIEGNTDEVHSGEYIIGGIIHQASKDSIYNNIMVLFRNGLNIKGLLKDFESRHSSEPIADAKITVPSVTSTIG